jgi:hypothetical protein
MNLPETISETIKSSELQSVTMEIAEVAIDGILEEGLVKDIPIVGSIYSVTKGIITISDRLLLKKLMLFIYELKDLTPEEREKQIKKIETSSKYKSSIGEKLLMIIDKTNDSEKSSLIGKLFLHCLKNEMSYGEFIRCTDIINNIDVVLLNEAINSDYTEIPIDQEDDLVSSGMFAFRPPNIELENYDNTYAHLKEGAELEIRYRLKEIQWSGAITHHGKLIRKFLRN